MDLGFMIFILAVPFLGPGLAFSYWYKQMDFQKN